MGRWPNFLVIGAAKSGTSSLYHYLKEHPDIFLPRIKETNFFAYDASRPAQNVFGEQINNKFPVKTADAYKSLFAGAQREKAIGEVSPIYLESSIACRNIKTYLPHIKLLVILRNPVDRAFSGYLMRKKMTGGKVDLETDFKNFENTHAAIVGQYYKLLINYYRSFDADQIHIVLFDDFQNRLDDTMRQIFAFLGIDESYEIRNKRIYNPGGIGKNRFIRHLFSQRHVKILTKIMPTGMQNYLKQKLKRRHTFYPTMEAALRKRMIAFYQDDIIALSQLINKDLRRWLTN